MAFNFFDGYIEVQNNIVVAVYDGSDLTTNLLYPFTGAIIPPDPNIWGFTNYQNNLLYDNAYRTGVWQEFDTFGLTVNADANLNTAFFNSNYSYFNFAASLDPTTTSGVIIGFNATGTTSIPRQVTMSLVSSPNPICFNYDTKIMCLNKSFRSKDDKDVYIPIQNINKTNMVKTYKHGYKKVIEIRVGTFINDPKDPYKSMYIMRQNDNNGLTEDLIVTGAHSVLEDRLIRSEMKKQRKIEKIEDKFLVTANVSRKFSVIENNNLYTYYHIVLEGGKKYGIWANGILTESTV